MVRWVDAIQTFHKCTVTTPVIEKPTDVESDKVNINVKTVRTELAEEEKEEEEN